MQLIYFLESLVVEYSIMCLCTLLLIIVAGVDVHCGNSSSAQRQKGLTGYCVSL